MSCGFILTPNYSLTGDCSNTNSGAIYFDISGSTAPPYDVYEVGSTGLLPYSGGVTSYSATSLSAGTYTLAITDTCGSPSPQTIYVPFYISSGSCVSLTGTTNTTCGVSNGVINGVISPYYGSGTVTIYETTDGFINQNSIGAFGEFSFPNLSAGTYYVVSEDGGGCTGKSETCIVKPSTSIDYGVYVVDNGSCITSEGSGKIFITGQTGTPPYTYSWSPTVNGQSGSTVTGLTSGYYNVTVTDSLGCSKTTTFIEVETVQPVGIVNFVTVSPSCFFNDGVVEVQLTGGTAPFYFSGSNGSVGVTFDNTFTFSGLPSGVFYVTVIDAGLCTTTSNVSLLTPSGFNVTSITSQNSNCNNIDGFINIQINSGTNSGPFLYSILDSSGNTIDSISQGSNYTSPPLVSGVYTVIISNGVCTYTQSVTINNTNLYTITANTSGTTCGLNNGVIEILTSSGGILPYTYQITGSAPTLGSTFNNLASGFYTVTVTDGGGCTQTETVYVGNSVGVYFDFFTTQPFLGNDGEISALITSGLPPFTLNWSSNVNGQTGTTVTGLTAGTYTLEVIDSNGCSLTRTTTLNGTVYYGGYQSYNVCDNNFTNTGILGRRGVLQMFNEGFYDLTYNDIGCDLNSATFTVDITVNGVNQQNIFYTSTSLTDYPTDNEWVNAIKTLLYSFSGITSVTTNIDANEIIIKSGCLTGGTDCQPVITPPLDDTSVIINLIINYDISCVECNGVEKIFQDDVEFMFMDDINYSFQ
jgi:hypothetical protein